MSAHTVTPTAASGAGHASSTAVPAPVIAVDERTRVTTERGRVALAVLRIATGFVFLWAFLDKTFGLGFSTPVERAWINGGKPAQGFLTSPAVTGPLTDFFAGLANPLVDALFMLAMLGIGLAVILGIGLRVSAVVGTGVMLMMYLAEWPFTAGTASTNPLVDYHIVYALALIVVAYLSAGDTFGLGRAWRRLPIVRSQRWLV
ncbi:DoxX family protein [Clavibacter michiganensis]|uniref:DoxX family protein n=1 Tax=Clavibacter michiganensis TaxID=28447 RepID=UPI000B368986|nr:DoxX family protein [Clavibacter michiganensis]MBW8026266.1 DoxX family protein [Clavibacter michiganensis subsp. michiganensis]MDO4032112.1 DoxX family protein [Clavibacter michiganensis]MDO4081330.1 DoxX family protein [Clavibacter michiganensis]MDO4087508.1 DoxX family protein [Clavibacter michiganensis]MDO4097204.1 DoxX family protein [Clavibacter michiganensis]